MAIMGLITKIRKEGRIRSIIFFWTNRKWKELTPHKISMKIIRYTIIPLLITILLLTTTPITYPISNPHNNNNNNNKSTCAKSAIASIHTSNSSTTSTNANNTKPSYIKKNSSNPNFLPSTRLTTRIVNHTTTVLTLVPLFWTRVGVRLKSWNR